MVEASEHHSPFQMAGSQIFDVADSSSPQIATPKLAGLDKLLRNVSYTDFAGYCENNEEVKQYEERKQESTADLVR
jgi:hypothetical protein